MESDEWSEWAANHPSVPIVSIISYLLFVVAAKFIRYTREENWRFDFTHFTPRPWDAQKDSRINWRYVIKLWDIDMIVRLWKVGAYLFVAQGFHHVIPHLVRIIWTEGMTYSFCDYTWYMDDAHRVEWYLDLFVAFKFLGLVDTVLLVGQNKEITFRHWYRRVTGVIFTWYAYTHDASMYLWFVALECASFPVLPFSSTFRSVLQKWQSFIMILVLFYSGFQTDDCEVDWTTILLGLFFYTTYLKVY